MGNPLNLMSTIYYNNRLSDDILFIVQDVCGPVYMWPKYIKCIVTSKTFFYSERVKLATFFWVNELREADEWLQFIVRIKGASFSRYSKEISNFNLKEQFTQRTYFSFCVIHKQYEYLDGFVCLT